ncbi:MAG TPA: sigma-70 family RNA polymerase sigma factor [Thermoanaerobaculia bacterium]|nr:sigma-70 family RNA polymerase sigma factor [Thermoanaerobaculia bacterium]
MSALDQPQVEVSLESFLTGLRPRLKTLFAHYRIPLQETEDILQQALLALVYQRQKVRDPEAWLLGTVRNKCLLYWRCQRRKLYDAVDAAVLDCIAEPAAPAQEGVDLRRDLENALERLPERCRSLLSLRYRQGYEPPELAARLGYSPSSINKITTRCLAALTRHLTTPGCRKKTDDG